MADLRLFDTHCHFASADAEAIAAQLKRAKAAGVERVMAVGGSAELNAAAAVAGAQGCLVAQGIDRDQTESELENFAPSVKLAGWGEIGLDYHYSPETRGRQLKLFSVQLERARQAALPVVIHTREAEDDTLALLREIPSRGIIHCFTGSSAFAKKLLDLGFYVSISGIVTFKSADNVRAAARVIPDDRLLLETDSPYLAPVPMRGRDNEPAFLRHTCEALAKLRGVAAEDLASITFANAERILAL